MPLVLLMVAGLFNISADNLALKTWPLAKNTGELVLVLFLPLWVLKLRRMLVEK